MQVPVAANTLTQDEKRRTSNPGQLTYPTFENVLMTSFQQPSLIGVAGLPCAVLAGNYGTLHTMLLSDGLTVQEV